MGIINNNLKSFQIKSNYPQWLLWLAMVVLFILAWTAVGIWARYTALNELEQITDLYEPDGIYYQPTAFACVPSSIKMLLRDQGMEATIYDVALHAGTDIFGTGASGVRRAGRYYGFEVESDKVGFDEVNARNEPGIILFRDQGTRHAAYVKPVPNFNMVEVKDPVQGVLYLEKESADEYFGSDTWDMHFFVSSE